MLIKKPTKSPEIAFEDENSQEHSIKVTTLSHLYGEAVASARILNGGQDPQSMMVYDCFRTKIVDHLKASGELPMTVSSETVFLIAAEMEKQLEELKKTCIVTVN